jgi:hypothetical protein
MSDKSKRNDKIVDSDLTTIVDKIDQTSPTAAPPTAETINLTIGTGSDDIPMQPPLTTPPPPMRP